MYIGFRTDSSYKIGTGHVYRCLKLAESFKKKNINCIFFSKNYAGNINHLIKKKFKLVELPISNLKKVKSKKFIISDYNKTVGFIKRLKIKLIFIDNYIINNKWEDIISKYCKTVLISDGLKKKAKCDYLINYNLMSDSKKENNKILNSNCKKLIGPDYTIIREHKNKNYKKKITNKITVYMGGVDTKNYTMKIISILKNFKLRKYKISVIIGQKNKNKKEIVEKIKDCKNFEFLLGDKKSLYNYYKNSCLVISNGGTSMFEHMTLGLKAIVVAQTEVQKKICQELSNNNLINFFPNVNKINYNNIISILKKKFSLKKSAKLRRLYDGKGIKRIVEYFANEANFRDKKISKT